MRLRGLMLANEAGGVMGIKGSLGFAVYRVGVYVSEG